MNISFFHVGGGFGLVYLIYLTSFFYFFFAGSFFFLFLKTTLL